MVQSQRGGVPLQTEVAALDPADAMLSRDRPTEADRQLEQLIAGLVRPLDRGAVAAVKQKARVQIAVAGMTPAARVQSVAPADLDGADDRLGEPVEWYRHVFRKLSAHAVQ